MGWSSYRNNKAGIGKSASGNRFAMVQGAISSLFSADDSAASQSHSVYQKVQMQGDTHYSLSAWLQVSAGTAHVRAVVKAPNGENITAGAIDAQSGCWTMLKGGNDRACLSLRTRRSLLRE
ncbi:Endo-1,4-beta-xylanase C [Hordeum vulgare]|nr:Endo-1,4-beta-xylanase C [Hordeum vulgare]